MEPDAPSEPLCPEHEDTVLGDVAAVQWMQWQIDNWLTPQIESLARTVATAAPPRHPVNSTEMQRNEIQKLRMQRALYRRLMAAIGAG